MKYRILMIPIALFFVISLLFTSGCSTANIDNRYDKAGPIYEFMGEGPYYYSRIKITTAEEGVSTQPEISVFEEGKHSRPFPWQPTPRNHRLRNRPSRGPCDPSDIPTNSIY